MTEVDKFYVNNPNRPSRYYFVLTEYQGNDYDYILWDKHLNQFKYGSKQWLIDNNPFPVSEKELERIFIKGVLKDLDGLYD